MARLGLAAAGLALAAAGGLGGYLIGEDSDRPARRAPVPAGWSLCTNPVRGYAIGYPGGWHAEHLATRDACRAFDPRPFEIPRDSEFPTVALEVLPEEVSFTRVQEFARDPLFWQVRGFEETAVAGRRAVRVDAIATGEGLYPRGTRVYVYVIDREGRGFVVQTTSVPGRPADRATIDVAVRTLRFF